MAEKLRANYQDRVAAESSGLRQILAHQKRFGVSYLRIYTAMELFLNNAHHYTGSRWFTGAPERQK